jgi:probable HAF family extracellular repeat protein
MVDLETSGATYVVATAVNDFGKVVGYGDHAFSWTKAGGMVDLGTLGGSTSAANAVNDFGKTVGEGDLAGGVSHAVLWTATAP